MEGLQVVPVAFGDSEWLLCLAGELDFATVGRVRARLREFNDTPVVLDLGALTFTDSTGLALLLEERARAQQHGRELRIRGANGQTRELLERTGVLSLLSSDAP
jgi:anti-anti-sigma factor